MLPENHNNVILKNTDGLYIGVLSNSLDNKIIGFSKLDCSIGEDIDKLQPNQIGIIFVDYEYEEITLKRIYTIGDDSNPDLDLIKSDSTKLYELVNDVINQYNLNNKY